MRIAREVALYNQSGIQDGLDDAESRASKVATSFITRVSESEGIKVHNADDLTDYIQINSNGVDLVNDNVSIANFGESARIGKQDSSHFMVNADSLQGYDASNEKYFEVSANGITWGNNSAASTDYADQAEADAVSTASADATAKANAAQANAEKVATNFITTDSTGIKVHNTNDTSNYTHIGSDGMDVRQSGNSVAKFGAYSRIGKEEAVHILASADGLQFAGGNGRDVFDVHLTGATATRFLTERFNKTIASLAGTPVSGTTIRVRCRDSTSGGVTIFEFTAGTSASKTYSKGSSNYTATYSASSQKITMSGSNSPRVVWASYTTDFPNIYATIGIRSYGDDEEDPSTAGAFSLAQGLQNRASGEASTALNYGTAADGDYQTVVGKWNVPDTTSPFIVGRGSSSNGRANALIVDSDGNLKVRGKVYANCAADSSGGVMPVLKVTQSSVSTLPKTITDSRITADMEVLHSVLSNPSAQTGDWTVTTYGGYLTITGSVSGTTNITLYLTEPSA